MRSSSTQRGGTILGFILGLLVGLGAAFGVAVYVSKIPIPFVTRDDGRAADANVEQSRNQGWNPNAALGGKVTPVPVVPSPQPEAAPETDTTVTGTTATAVPGSSDPLGDLVQAKVSEAATNNSSGYNYFVQAGAFRNKADADAQRVKLGLLGQQARVTQREQNGRPVYRVRIGPLTQRGEAEALKKQLDGSGMETALVRVQQ